MFHIFEKIKNNDVYIIAEMSANHGGSLEHALEIVRRAKAAGADCLKIQTYTADSITLNCDSDDFMIHGGLWDGYKLYDLYTDAGTPYEWHKAIKEECDKCGIDFLSTPFDFEAVDFLEELGVEAYKIASFELVDIPLIKYAASKQKPMIMSCGMASVDEIKEAVETCLSVGNDKIVLLKCCSEYPAKTENMHLANIPAMKSKFRVEVGLSDHSEGYLADVIGVSVGASVIEKHVKLEEVESADSKFSMDIDSFKEMVDKCRETKRIIGETHFGPTEGEVGNYKFRRSLFASADIKQGEPITEKNIKSVRPATGLAPKYYEMIIGKKAVCDISFGTPLTMNMFE